MQAGEVILAMYGYAVDVLHHMPKDVGVRSVHVVPGNPASKHNVVEYEHVFGISVPAMGLAKYEFIRTKSPVN